MSRFTFSARSRKALAGVHADLVRVAIRALELSNTDFVVTEGLRTAQRQAELVRAGAPASEVLHRFDPLPQLLKNVRFSGGKPLENETVKSVIAAAETELDGTGRVLIRASGTEPVLRVMAEAEDEATVQSVVDGLCDIVATIAAEQQDVGRCLVCPGRCNARPSAGENADDHGKGNDDCRTTHDQPLRRVLPFCDTRIRTPGSDPGSCMTHHGQHA